MGSKLIWSKLMRNSSIISNLLGDSHKLKFILYVYRRIHPHLNPWPLCRTLMNQASFNKWRLRSVRFSCYLPIAIAMSLNLTSANSSKPSGTFWWTPDPKWRMIWWVLHPDFTTITFQSFNRISPQTHTSRNRTTTPQINGSITSQAQP